MNETIRISYKVISPEIANESLFYIFIFLIGLLIILSVFEILRNKIKIKKKGLVTLEEHRYNLFIGVAIGLQIAFILEVINMIKKLFVDGNIYLVDIFVAVLIMVLWLGEEFISKTFIGYRDKK